MSDAVLAAGRAADPVAVADGAGHPRWGLVGGADVGHGVAGEGFGHEPAPRGPGRVGDLADGVRGDGVAFHESGFVVEAEQ